MNSISLMLLGLLASVPCQATAATLTKSVGIETLGGVLTPIISQGEELPASRVRVFSTADDDQTEITIHLRQGTVEKHSSLGRWQVRGIAPAPRGKPSIAVTVAVDEREQVTLSAKDNAMGTVLPVTRLDD